MLAFGSIHRSLGQLSVYFYYGDPQPNGFWASFPSSRGVSFGRSWPCNAVRHADNRWGSEDTRHHEKGGDTPHGERKLAKLPDSSWDEMSWYMPNVERGEVSYDEVFHHPAVREYVQSEDFVNYIYAKLGKEYAIGDQIGLAFIRAFQFFGPLTFFLIQIHRKS